MATCKECGTKIPKDWEKGLCFACESPVENERYLAAQKQYFENP